MSGALSLTSFVMTIVNFFTAEYVLLFATLIFSVLCLINILVGRLQCALDMSDSKLCAADLRDKEGKRILPVCNGIAGFSVLASRWQIDADVFV